MPVFTKESIPTEDIQCDVCIIGSGAGGATVAAGLTQLGLDVVVLEAGEYHTQKDFDMDEAKAFQLRYQEQGLRSTDDVSIAILQGRGVGGSTTINWTSCFRTPPKILDLWQDKFGIQSLSTETLAAHFDAVEERLSIQNWQESLINPNNQVLMRGAKKLGWDYATLRRNVKGCHNSGYCGMGCPTNAKQGMLVTHIADGLQNGMRLYANTEAEKIVVHNNKVEKIIVRMDVSKNGKIESIQRNIYPKICVSSCGAINGPALFLRSNINHNDLVGTRTFLHPVVGLASIFTEAINGWYGAPQSVSSHHFIERGVDKVGFFFEAAPTHPILAATAATGFGHAQQEFMKKLSHASFLIALHRDGVVDGDNGGTVSVTPSGRIKLQYPISTMLQESFRTSMQKGAELCLAAGATEVQSLHSPAVVMKTTSDIQKLDQAFYGTLQHRIFTAHQMGGLAMGADPKSSVVNDHLQHHQISNLFVVDGSVFPTSLGVNPSETIYAIAHWAVQHIHAAL